MKLVLTFIFVFFFLFITGQKNDYRQVIEWAKDHSEKNPKTAIDTLLRTAESEKNKGNYLEYTEILTVLGQIYAFELNNHNLTLDILKKIDEAYQETKDKNIRVYYLLVLGYINYANKEDSKKVFEIYQKCWEICPKDHPKWIYVLINYGGALVETGKMDEGLRMTIKAYDEAKKTGDYGLCTMTSRNLGVAYSYKNMSDSAIFYYKRALQESMLSGKQEDILDAKLALAIFCYDHSQRDSALIYMNMIINEIEHFRNHESRELCYRLISKIYEDKGEFKNAYEYSLLALQYNDSAKISESTRQLLAYEFELEVKEMNKKTESEKRQMEYDREKQELIYIIVVLGLITIIIFVWIIFLRLRNKKKLLKIKAENAVLENQKIQMDLEFEERAVATKTMFLLEKDNMINKVINILSSAVEKNNELNRKVITDVIFDLRNSLNNKRWEEFEFRFNKIHPNFYTRLEKDKPNLSNNEKRLCAFLLMEMSSKEISNITGQSIHSINVARTRLRRKLGLTNSEDSISHFLSKLTGSGLAGEHSLLKEI